MRSFSRPASPSHSREPVRHRRRHHRVGEHHGNQFVGNGKILRQIAPRALGERNDAIGIGVSAPQNSVGDAVLQVGIALLRDRRTADLAQNKLRPARSRQCAHRDKRAKIEARFRTDDDGRSQVADQAAQAGNGVTQLSSGNLGDANSGIEQAGAADRRRASAKMTMRTPLAASALQSRIISRCAPPPSKARSTTASAGSELRPGFSDRDATWNAGFPIGLQQE